MFRTRRVAHVAANNEGSTPRGQYLVWVRRFGWGRVEGVRRVQVVVVVVRVLEGEKGRWWW